MTEAVANATLSVAAILAESARRYPDHVAITVGDSDTTYAQLWDQSRSYAGALRAQGIGPDDRVAILIPNVTDFARVYYAVLALGATAVPIHALLKRHEIAYMLQDADVKTLVCAAPLLGEGAPGAETAGATVFSVLSPEAGAHARLEDLAAAAEPIAEYMHRSPLDIATILYTSGTTGKPKGALGTHLSLVEQVNVILLNTLDIRSGDKIFGGLPLFHTFGQTVVLNAGLRVGAQLMLLPKFTGAAALDLLQNHGINVFCGVPTMYVALLEAAREKPGPAPELRYAVSGGSALPVSVLNRFHETFGGHIHEGYGLTETSPVATFNHVGRPARAGTIGTPIWGVEVEIARTEVYDAIELLPRGEVGELVIRGHNLFSGYLNRPEATAEAMVDGWFRTGDLGTKDADDYVSIVDRKKDMILRNGYNVYPREVEEALIRHPEITNAAVFGVEDPTHGQEIAAAITLAPGSTLDAEAIRAYAAEQVAAYKYPRLIHIVTEFPLGPSGKILKRELVVTFSRE
ncbi:long-chain-fatty-acid--CoA ligase [Paeniglutamicibacter cryotolerans]|uniref:Long-chain acyl-CoA synthetase n=1 Tax=Paeniglutamicibacter cryotolerans TaxID=670079 RepID=A0A839QJP8_9MICC|nr:long-chain fatty acid--CoA ligase [Paeniglutamicibacter cryotolerans]MBB2994765.1 long-chain acyl-CoA synthetase [Paeniglutamicibacter cryotolerans]